MDKTFRIGEIADFFNIPSSTLRYWNDKGVLKSKKNIENNYREYDFMDLIEISDVIFYKTLGIPLKQISSIENMELKEYKELFELHKISLDNELELLNRRIEKLKKHQSAIDEVIRLKDSGIKYGSIDIDTICGFELTEINKISLYISDPSLYIRVHDSDNLKYEKRGIIIESFNNEDIIWKKRTDKYAIFLMKEEVSEKWENNLCEYITKIKEDYNTGKILSRFLCRASENGKIFDFYKCYVEII